MGAYWWLWLIPLLVLHVVWVHRFLTRTRPRLREVWSRRLGLTIGHGPSLAWQAPPGSGVLTGIKVAAIDFGLLAAATLGPVAAVLIGLVWAFG